MVITFAIDFWFLMTLILLDFSCRYALGGYDGVQMVPTVEVFDPRIGSWMMGDPMNDSRGYSGAFTIGEKIYVMGGMKDDEEFLDTVTALS